MSRGEREDRRGIREGAGGTASRAESGETAKRVRFRAEHVRSRSEGIGSRSERVGSRSASLGPAGSGGSAPSKAAATERAYATAVRLLAARALSVAEVRQRLARRGHSGEDIDSAVEALLVRRYLDDRALAYNVATSLTTRRMYARGRVALEIQRRGIDAVAARDALDRAFAGIDEEDMAIGAARAEASRARSSSEAGAGAAARIARALLRRGFPHGAVVRALRAIGMGIGGLAGADPEEWLQESDEDGDDL